MHNIGLPVVQKSICDLDKKTLKQTKENETMTEIKNTFSSVFLHLILYIYMLVSVYKFISKSNDSDYIYILRNTIKQNFMMEDFNFNFTIYDYNTRNSYNNFNINGYSQYQIRTNLNEAQEFSQIFQWLRTFYFDKLGFYMKENQNKKCMFNLYPVINIIYYLNVYY